MRDTTKPATLFSRIRSRLTDLARIPNQLQALRDLLLEDQTRQRQLTHPNPLNAFGRKCFSQSDEDGITLEILRRVGRLEGGVYAEFGVGNGIENNSLVLASLGWEGFWVGGEALQPAIVDAAKPGFAYVRDWITLDNIEQLTRSGLQAVQADRLDFVSLDLDGNDIYFVERLLSMPLRPALFIVEYNAKFPPPIEFQIAYDAAHAWQGDDYFGASLSSFAKLFARFDYRLVCCNSHSGANAFFIDGQYAARFADVPSDVGQIYVGPRFHLYGQYGHPASLRTIERIFNAR